MKKEYEKPVVEVVDFCMVEELAQDGDIDIFSTLEGDEIL